MPYKNLEEAIKAFDENMVDIAKYFAPNDTTFDKNVINPLAHRLLNKSSLNNAEILDSFKTLFTDVINEMRFAPQYYSQFLEIQTVILDQFSNDLISLVKKEINNIIEKRKHNPVQERQRMDYDNRPETTQPTAKTPFVKRRDKEEQNNEEWDMVEYPTPHAIQPPGPLAGTKGQQKISLDEIISKFNALCWERNLNVTFESSIINALRKKGCSNATDLVQSFHEILDEFLNNADIAFVDQKPFREIQKDILADDTLQDALLNIVNPHSQLAKKEKRSDQDKVIEQKSKGFGFGFGWLKKTPSGKPNPGTSPSAENPSATKKPR